MIGVSTCQHHLFWTMNNSLGIKSMYMRSKANMLNLVSCINRMVEYECLWCIWAFHRNEMTTHLEKEKRIATYVNKECLFFNETRHSFSFRQLSDLTIKNNVFYSVTMKIMSTKIIVDVTCLFSLFEQFPSKKVGFRHLLRQFLTLQTK